MKIAIILSGSIESQPYIRYYTDVLDTLNEVEYEFICWNRDEKNPLFYNNHKIISIDVSGSITNSNFKKIYDYFLFSKKVTNYLNENRYDFLIIHTLVNAVFLKKILLRYYKNKYVFDIRDYSPIYPFTKHILTNIVKNSFFTVISSEGFLDWLPKSSKYILGHNVSKQKLVLPFIENQLLDLKNKELTVLTIGKIRDFSSNARVIVNLGDKSKIKMVFAGSGIESKKLETFSINKYSNVLFTGIYKKTEEGAIVNLSHFINIVLPINRLSNTLISNRFYLGLTHRRIMIVNQESFHAKYVKKYNLGIIVKSEDDIFQKITEYILFFDYALFEKGCIDLLNLIEKDIVSFEKKLASIID